MDQHRALDILSGRRRGVGASLLRGALSLAARPYSGTMRLRRWAYGRGILPSRQPGAPNICVGNITTGGTGKTPTVAWAVKQLASAGCKPAILTRGYKSCDGASDEADLLRTLTSAPVIVNGDRIAGAETAVAGGADVLVMDDGFGHLRLRRDMDIVLIDATQPFGYDRCLPRGLLREPLWALRDADAIVITRSDAVYPGLLEAMQSRLHRIAPRASQHTAVHRPRHFIDDMGAPQPLDALAGKSICAFCGIGNPESFFRTLQRLGAGPAERIVLDDHVHYTPQTIDSLRLASEKCSADVFVTTQKDHVKLTDVSLGRGVWQLVVAIEFTDGGEELRDEILAVAHRKAPSKPIPET